MKKGPLRFSKAPQFQEPEDGPEDGPEDFEEDGETAESTHE